MCGIDEKKIKIAEKILENTKEGIVITNVKGDIEWVNPAFTIITGYEKEEVLGKNPRILKSKRHDSLFYKNMWRSISQKGFWQNQIWNRRKDGETYLEWLTIASVLNDRGKITHYISVFHDLTESMLKEEYIKYQANYDALTGLPNRYLLKDRIDRALTHACKNKKILAVFFLDVDRFKRINETLGHHVGDVLIQKIGKRLKECMDEEDTVGRLGGDEFIIILEEEESANHIIKKAQKVLDIFHTPFLLNGYTNYITASMGISIYPSDGENADHLIKNAETAMYRAKAKGKNGYQLYTAKMNQKALEKLTIENDMYKALEQKEFVLYYQPQVEAITGAIIGVEALIRWNHPKRGMIGPGEFIPLAEETGFIVPLGEWVIYEACRQGTIWEEKGIEGVQISVNLSPLQFQQKNIIEKIKKILENTGMKAENLEVEITESGAMIDPEFTIDLLKEMKKMNIKVAIDDFGTGYSSLSYFTKFPIDKMKIDQSFIRNIWSDERNKAVVLAIIKIAKSLGLSCIAEGVETQEELDLLIEYECEQIQGYFYSPPISAESFEELYKNSNVAMAINNGEN
ncbi:sensor domain-containing protein [Inediibacterium massiliense]|uniref:sensor domain-containing protein n=1 Tax=Inediibacterium massiliense TaxID=1658111 RepID=UPI0006B67068|nr:EAL domain-containing protein [Inediibacterium massiliense]